MCFYLIAIVRLVKISFYKKSKECFQVLIGHISVLAIIMTILKTYYIVVATAGGLWTCWNEKSKLYVMLRMSTF